MKINLSTLFYCLMIFVSYPGSLWCQEKIINAYWEANLKIDSTGLIDSGVLTSKNIYNGDLFFELDGKDTKTFIKVKNINFLMFSAGLKLIVRKYSNAQNGIFCSKWTGKCAFYLSYNSPIRYHFYGLHQKTFKQLQSIYTGSQFHLTFAAFGWGGILSQNNHHILMMMNAKTLGFGFDLSDVKYQILPDENEIEISFSHCPKMKNLSSIFYKAECLTNWIQLNNFVQFSELKKINLSSSHSWKSLF